MRLATIACPPSGHLLWAICAQFGLLWSLRNPNRQRRRPSSPKSDVGAEKDREDGGGDDETATCLGFAPSGCSWSLVAPGPSTLWAVDVEGRVWVHVYTDGVVDACCCDETEESGCKWTFVTAPRVRDISCSPDGKVG